MWHENAKPGPEHGPGFSIEADQENGHGFQEMIDSGLVGSTDFGRGSARAEDAQGTPSQSDVSPSILSIRRKNGPRLPNVLCRENSKQEESQGMILALACAIFQIAHPDRQI